MDERMIHSELHQPHQGYPYMGIIDTHSTSSHSMGVAGVAKMVDVRCVLVGCIYHLMLLMMFVRFLDKLIGNIPMSDHMATWSILVRDSCDVAPPCDTG